MYICKSYSKHILQGSCTSLCLCFIPLFDCLCTFELICCCYCCCCARHWLLQFVSAFEICACINFARPFLNLCISFWYGFAWRSLFSLQFFHSLFNCECRPTLTTSGQTAGDPQTKRQTDRNKTTTTTMKTTSTDPETPKRPQKTDARVTLSIFISSLHAHHAKQKQKDNNNI